MTHPFAWLAVRARRRAFAAATALTLLCGAGLQALGAALVTPEAPRGIVSFELAGDVATAERMLGSWDAQARVRAGLSLGADYLFLFLYALAIGLGCALLGDALGARSPGAAALGAVLAWGQLAAAVLDAAENLALIQLLLGSREPHWPALAWWCALPKFVLVAAGLAWLAAGGAALALRLERPGRSA